MDNETYTPNDKEISDYSKECARQLKEIYNDGAKLMETTHTYPFFDKGIMTLYKASLIKENLWSTQCADAPDILAFKDYEAYEKHSLEQCKSFGVMLKPITTPFNSRLARLLVKELIKTAKMQVEARPAFYRERSPLDKMGKVHTQNSWVLASLMGINTEAHTPPNDEAYIEGLDEVLPVYKDPVWRALNPEKKGVAEARVQVYNWTNGLPLHLFLIIYNKLYETRERATTSDLISFVYEKGLFENELGVKYDLHIPLSEIIELLGLPNTPKTINKVQEQLAKAYKSLRGLDFEIRGALSGGGSLIPFIGYDHKAQSVYIQCSPVLHYMAKIGAFFPVHKEILQLDKRNIYASPIYIKLAEQVNLTYCRATAKNNKQRIEGFKNSIKLKTLCEAVGLGRFYEREKHLPHLKARLIASLECIKKEARGFEWAFTDNALQAPDIKSFYKAYFCFNLPNIERGYRNNNKIIIDA